MLLLLLLLFAVICCYFVSLKSWMNLCKFSCVCINGLFYLLQPISQWTSTNVVEWMAALNLYRYAELFRSKDIKGVDLLSLDKDKLMVRSAIYFLDPIGEGKRNMRDASLRRCWIAAIRPRDVNAKMAEPRRREIRIATSSIPRMPTLSLFQFRIVRKGRWVRRRRSDGPNKLSISEAASSDLRIEPGPSRDTGKWGSQKISKKITPKCWS